MFLLVFFICQLIRLFFPSSAFAQVVISEVYPQPENGESEWVEIINIGSRSADLSEWILRDKISTPKKIYSFSNFSLEPLAVFVATISSSLNNGSDGVSLFNSVGDIVSTMDYKSSQSGLSWVYDFKEDKYWETNPSWGVVDLGQAPSPTPMASPMVSPTPAIEQDINGKIELVSVLSCPINGDEWIEIKNISSENISRTIYVSDSQNNIISFDLLLVAGSSQKYYFERHIINNSGDKLSFYQSSQSDDLLSQYYVPECKEKNIPFVNISGKLLADNSGLSTGDSEEFNDVEKDIKSEESFENGLKNENKNIFELGDEYLNRLHYLDEIDNDKNLLSSSSSSQAKFIEKEDETSLLFEKKSLIFSISLILIGTTLSIICIMYLYGNKPKEDITMD